MENSTPKEWSSLLDVLEERKGIAILLGATDTGKNHLLDFLIPRLCQRGLRVGLVDADLEDSFLGPPATVCSALFKSHPDWEIVLSPPEIFFVGATTPEGYFPIHLRGVKSTLDKTRSCGPEVILIHTTGFISGEAGKELKRRKIDLVSPRFVLALQKHDELEAILEPYQGNPLYTIIRLPLSGQANPRSLEERRIHRANKFRDYFKHSVIQELPLGEVQIEGEVLDPTGAPLPIDWSLKINGLLVGLKNAEDETLALGVVRSYSETKKSVRIFTPLTEIQGIKRLQLSSLRITLLYENESS